MFRSRRYAQVHGSPPPLPATTLLFLGLVLGLAGGLFYAWLINPIVYINARPAQMSEEYQEEYIFLISQSYAYTGDWELAVQRLDDLDAPDLPQRVALLFERYLRQGAPAESVRNLANLTRRLGGDNPALTLFNPTPEPPALTATPTRPISTPTATLLPTPSPTRPPTSTIAPTPTPSPSPSPTATPRPNFRLLSQERVCAPDEPAPLIVVQTLDAELEPQAGVEVVVEWAGGRDRFFTGFRLEEDPGYADFVMTPDVSYSVFLAEGSPTIGGLRIEACANGQPGGWALTFQNLRLPTPTPTR
jgi:hypothetical protein